MSEGFRRPVPAVEWSSLRLSLTEREEISRGLAVGETMRFIGARLGRAPSMVSREVVGNGGRRRYRATGAHQASRHRARRPKPAKLASNHRLRGVVEAKLEAWWSPTQISEWLVDAPSSRSYNITPSPLFSSHRRPACVHDSAPDRDISASALIDIDVARAPKDLDIRSTGRLPCDRF